MKTLNVPSEMPKDLRIYAIMLIGRISTLPYLSKGMAQREFAQIQKDISALRESDFICRYWDLYDDLEANLNSAMNQGTVTKTLSVPSEMPKDLRNYVIMLIGRISALPHISKGMAQREFAQIQKDISALREFDFYCRYWDLYDDLEANLNAAMSSRDA